MCFDILADDFEKAIGIHSVYSFYIQSVFVGFGFGAFRKFGKVVLTIKLNKKKPAQRRFSHL